MRLAFLLVAGILVWIGAAPPADAQDQAPSAQSRQAPSGSGGPPSTQGLAGQSLNPSANSNMPVIRPPGSAGSNMPVLTPPQSGSNMPVINPHGTPDGNPQGQPK